VLRETGNTLGLIGALLCACAVVMLVCTGRIIAAVMLLFGAPLLVGGAALLVSARRLERRTAQPASPRPEAHLVGERR
jgi:uncharacterized membrane protein HdeD (DUF308 family)